MTASSDLLVQQSLAFLLLILLCVRLCLPPLILRKPRRSAWHIIVDLSVTTLSYLLVIIEQQMKAVPFMLFPILIVMIAAYTAHEFASEIRRRKVTVSRKSIREALNDLPCGICFFDDCGRLLLCDRKMRELTFPILKHDLQMLSELENVLAESGIKEENKVEDDRILIDHQGEKWSFARSVLHDGKESFVQYIATDVTLLYQSCKELEAENGSLRQMHRELLQLSAQSVRITREEEILDVKIYIHDEMGYQLLSAQRLLSQEIPMEEAESIIKNWQSAAGLLSRGKGAADEDQLTQVIAAAADMGISIRINGELPDYDAGEYLIACALRECVTNAVRYAEAKHIFVEISRDEESYSDVRITNDGNIPESEILEGGGLSGLRRRIKRFGGSMEVNSKPQFLLHLKIPPNMEA